MPRELRRPAEAAEFNQLPLTARRQRLPASWWNLRWSKHARRGHWFYATVSGRLTPSSGQVPCLYLAEQQETSFHELYGDVIDAAAKRGQTPIFSRQELEERMYLRTTAPWKARLYDLTVERSAQKIGLDLATLYAPEVNFLRDFAQRLHDHPAKFDGIRYVSRHTQSPCVVLWATHTPELARLALERGPCLWDLVEFDRKAPIGSMRLFGAWIQAAAASP